MGLGAFAPLEGCLVFVVQALALALVGQVLAFRPHRNGWLLGCSVLATLSLFAGFYVVPSALLMQLGLGGFAAASVWLLIEHRRCAECAAPPSRSIESALR